MIDGAGGSDDTQPSSSQSAIVAPTDVLLSNLAHGGLVDGAQVGENRERIQLANAVWAVGGAHGAS